MAGAINRFADGLLALLDLKTRGQTPSELGGVVTPSIDMLPFYELGQSPDWVSTGGLATAGTFTAPVVVPEGETWLVRQVTLELESIAAGSWSGALVFGPSDAGLNLAALAAPTMTATGVGTAFSGVGQGGYLIWQPSTPFLVRAGWRFGCFSNTVAGGGFSALTSVLRSRYRS